MYNEFRGDTRYMAEAIKPNGIGVEVGVFDGDFALESAAIWKSVSEYHLVDVWDDFNLLVNPDDIFRHSISQAYQNVLEKCNQKPFVIHRMDSLSAVKAFADKSLDWVYLDGNHTFDNVTKELDAYWPKVSEGGIFCGHDYDKCGRPRYPIWVAVADAVRLWSRNNNIPIYECIDSQDWYTFKSKPVSPDELLVISDSRLDWPSRQIVIENHSNYCARWGYEYRHGNHIPKGYDGPWCKVEALLDAMQTTDKPWICWLDADGVMTNFSDATHRHCHHMFDMILGAFRNHFHPNGGPNTSRWIVKNCEWSRETLKQILGMQHWHRRFCHEENALDELVNARACPNILMIPSANWSIDPQWFHMYNLHGCSFVHCPNGNGSLRHGMLADLCSFAKHYNATL